VFPEKGGDARFIRLALGGLQGDLFKFLLAGGREGNPVQS